jgi:hypothetical protein
MIFRSPSLSAPTGTTPFMQSFSTYENYLDQPWRFYLSLAWCPRNRRSGARVKISPHRSIGCRRVDCGGAGWSGEGERWQTREEPTGVEAAGFFNGELTNR